MNCQTVQTKCGISEKCVGNFESYDIGWNLAGDKMVLEKENCFICGQPVITNYYMVSRGFYVVGPSPVISCSNGHGFTYSSTWKGNYVIRKHDYCGDRICGLISTCNKDYTTNLVNY